MDMKSSSGMKKRVISFEFETDASDEAIEFISNLMEVQLESLNDGTLDLGDEQVPDEVNEDYIITKRIVK
jgi:hypothetical protein